MVTFYLHFTIMESFIVMDYSIHFSIFMCLLVLLIPSYKNEFFKDMGVVSSWKQYKTIVSYIIKTRSISFFTVSNIYWNTKFL